VLKPNASLLRVLEKTILHDEIILQEKHKEALKDTPITNVLWDKPYNHAFLYTVYGNEIYLTYLRYSIMSLRMVSPACKIMVFVESKLWRKAKEELKGLLFDHDIVRVNGEQIRADPPRQVLQRIYSAGEGHAGGGIDSQVPE